MKIYIKSSESALGTYRVELVGRHYQEGYYSAPPSYTVEVEASSPEAALREAERAIRTVAMFDDCRIVDVYEKTPDVTRFDNLFPVYDVNGNEI